MMKTMMMNLNQSKRQFVNFEFIVELMKLM